MLQRPRRQHGHSCARLSAEGCTPSRPSPEPLGRACASVCARRPATYQRVPSFSNCILQRLGGSSSHVLFTERVALTAHSPTTCWRPHVPTAISALAAQWEQPLHAQTTEGAQPVHIPGSGSDKHSSSTRKGCCCCDERPGLLSSESESGGMSCLPVCSGPGHTCSSSPPPSGALNCCLCETGRSVSDSSDNGFGCTH